MHLNEMTDEQLALEIATVVMRVDRDRQSPSGSRTSASSPTWRAACRRSATS